MKILFVLAKNRSNKNGKSVVKCRVTYFLKRKEFSTGIFINPEHWNSRQEII
ncbi:Arm DNA-binding domain-containing protein [Mangrovimonas xylaniphaga]|uniref:Arm DNA-binding domain-containing protein n=1 Tax=Mangrovimonas xylaniphaga TaxID=1645915 RepID=UPI00373FE33B